MKSKWIEIDRDFDYLKSEKNIGFLIFKHQFKRIKKLVKTLNWTQHCSHEWDCCGCQFTQSASITFREGQVIIQLTKHYNY